MHVQGTAGPIGIGLPFVAISKCDIFPDPIGTLQKHSSSIPGERWKKGRSCWNIRVDFGFRKNLSLELTIDMLRQGVLERHSKWSILGITGVTSWNLTGYTKYLDV